jgi:hypothetical protein
VNMYILASKLGTREHKTAIFSTTMHVSSHSMFCCSEYEDVLWGADHSSKKSHQSSGRVTDPEVNSNDSRLKVKIKLSLWKTYGEMDV